VLIESEGEYEDDEGSAFLFLGGPGGLGLSAAWAAEPDEMTSYFGFSLDGVGDVNGDGLDDVIVGAYGFDQGRAFLYLGSSSGLSPTPAWTAEGDQTGAQFGYALVCRELSASFVAVWYSVGIGLAALLGALLGPRALRW